MIDLTKDQQNALDYIVENDWDVFILTGNAGTGKSTLLEIIQKSFGMGASAGVQKKQI